MSIDDARLKCEGYRHEFNDERPHCSIGYIQPVGSVDDELRANQPTLSRCGGNLSRRLVQ
ncbi:MAG: integrase core domain-containing protein [Geminicoccaceae bacterium]